LFFKIYLLPQTGYLLYHKIGLGYVLMTKIQFLTGAGKGFFLFLLPHPDQLWGPPSLQSNGYEVFPLG